MNVSLVENGTKHMLDALPNDGHFDLSRPLSHSKIKIPSIKGNKSKVAIDVSYLNNNEGLFWDRIRYLQNVSQNQVFNLNHTCFSF